MKQKIRNILIYTFFFTGIPYLRFLFLKRKSPVVRVLALHDIKESEKIDFIRFLNFLENKFNIISPQDFKTKKLHPKKINILLTFDDGYESWQTIAALELEKRGLGAYFFVSSGFLQTQGDEKAEREFCNKQLLISYRKPLSWDGLKKLAENKNNVIGGHTVNHFSLKNSSLEEQYKEIVECKNTIESKLGYKIDSFAYPFGVPGVDYNNQTIELVKKAGYEEAFTTEIVFADSTKDCFLIPRTCVNSYKPSSILYLIIIGVYDIMKKILNFLYF